MSAPRRCVRKYSGVAPGQNGERARKLDRIGIAAITDGCSCFPPRGENVEGIEVEKESHSPKNLTNHAPWAPDVAAVSSSKFSSLSLTTSPVEVSIARRSRLEVSAGLRGCAQLSQ